jgi:hypothetical protein
MNTPDAISWVTAVVKEFEDGRLFGHIIVEFRDGTPVLVEKKVATKLIQQYPNGANHGREYRTR